MRIFIGFDDTDTLDSPRGTGRLARLFAERLPDGTRLRGGQPVVPVTALGSGRWRALGIQHRTAAA